MTNDPNLPGAHDRLLGAIRIARSILLISMLAAALLVFAAVMAGRGGGLGLAAKFACLLAALVALTLLVLNLLALRAWRRARRGRATD